MEASFWTTMESYPQQATLGIINMLISRRTLMDSISRTLEVLYALWSGSTFTRDFVAFLDVSLGHKLPSSWYSLGVQKA